MIFCFQRFYNHYNFFQQFPLLFQELGKSNRDGHIFYSLIESNETEFYPIGTNQDYCLKVNGQVAAYFHKDYRNYFIYNREPMELPAQILPVQQLEEIEQDLPPPYEQQPEPQNNNLLQYLKCPITHEIMVQPVIMQDGYTYEKLAITNWLSRHNRSPMTNLPINNFQMIPNLVVSQLIHELI